MSEHGSLSLGAIQVPLSNCFSPEGKSPVDSAQRLGRRVCAYGMKVMFHLQLDVNFTAFLSCPTPILHSINHFGAWSQNGSFLSLSSYTSSINGCFCSDTIAILLTSFKFLWRSPVCWWSLPVFFAQQKHFYSFLCLPFCLTVQTRHFCSPCWSVAPCSLSLSRVQPCTPCCYDLSHQRKYNEKGHGNCESELPYLFLSLTLAIMLGNGEGGIKKIIIWNCDKK